MTLPPELREKIIKTFEDCLGVRQKTVGGRTYTVVDGIEGAIDEVVALLDPAIAELVEGLRPFAELFSSVEPVWRDTGDDGWVIDVEFGLIRRAIRLVAKYTEKPR